MTEFTNLPGAFYPYERKGASRTQTISLNQFLQKRCSTIDFNLKNINNLKINLFTLPTVKNNDYIVSTHCRIRY